MKIVFDTNILVRAATRPDGAAYALVQLALSQGHVPVGSAYLFDEVERVMAYPRVQALVRSTEAERTAFFETVRAAAEWHEPPTSQPAVTADPDDEPIAGLAVTANAAVLCTLDKHFHDEPARGTLAEKGVRVLTDLELLAELRQIVPPPS